MNKLLLTLTLVAFSSEVLCNAAKNQTDDSPTAAEFANAACKVTNVCTGGVVRDDYVIIRGMGTYKLHSNPKATWNEARQVCINEGAQLAIINSVAEAKMLADWLIRENATSAAWIGIHELFEEGYWVTLIGETLAAAGYDQWLPGEPNNEGGLAHCGSLHYLNGLYVLLCTDKLPYFCKMSIW